MGKSAPAAPPAPDPNVVAGAQTASNQQTAITQAQLNEVNQQTPFGNLTFSPTPGAKNTFNQQAYDAALQAYQDQLKQFNSAPQVGPNGAMIMNGIDLETGQPVASGTLKNAPVAPNPQDFFTLPPLSTTATVTLPPELQAALDKQNTLTNSLFGLANNQESRIERALAQPFDTSGITPLPSNQTQVGAIDQTAADAAFQQAKSRLDPQWSEQENLLKSQLQSQGLVPGDAAYDNAFRDFSNAKTDAYNQAQLSATQQGVQNAATNFGLAQSGQAQNIQTQNFLREQPLNEAIALMSGTQLGEPQFVNTPQTGVSPSDVTGAFGLSQAAKNVGFQGAVNTANSNNSAAAGLGGAAIGAAALAIF